MHDILKEMLAIWPHDPSVQKHDRSLHDAFLLDLVSRTDRVTNDQKSKHRKSGKSKISATSPESSSSPEQLRTTQSDQSAPSNAPGVGAPAAGTAEDALAVYQKLSVDPRVLTPSALAVHAAVLKATGHDADAQAEIDKLPMDRLVAGRTTVSWEVRQPSCLLDRIYWISF